MALYKNGKKIKSIYKNGEKIYSSDINPADYYTKTEVNTITASTQEALANHSADQIIHVTQADRDKWDAGGGSSGGGNQPVILHYKMGRGDQPLHSASNPGIHEILGPQFISPGFPSILRLQGYVNCSHNTASQRANCYFLVNSDMLDEYGETRGATVHFSPKFHTANNEITLTDLSYMDFDYVPTPYPPNTNFTIKALIDKIGSTGVLTIMSILYVMYFIPA